jgi:exodeoxyribonuclease VII large subunit
MSNQDDNGNRQIYTPTALNRLVRDLLEDVLPSVWIEGELSNVARPASGHIYFTVKDAQAQIRGAMFRMKASALRFRPVDGMHVLLRGRVGLYEARGEFQLVADHMELAGEGALQREFEQLKARLAAEGLFDSARKRPLPAMVQRIGIITSATGAAVRDVISVLRRRFALVEVDILPVPVQGREAPPLLRSMVQRAGASGRYDVLLLTRGGGSLEDLWAFNDEALARAIHACPVPVVSAVGHEIDFSIADFVADLRAATPSAAAELLVPDGADVFRQLARQRERLRARLGQRMQAAAQAADHWFARLQAQRPQARLLRDRQRLAGLEQRLRRLASHGQQLREHRLVRTRQRLQACHPGLRLAAHGQRLGTLDQRLRAAIARKLERDGAQLRQQARTLQAVSPLATLDRGYAIAFDSANRVIRRATDVQPGDALRIRLADGQIAARVDDAG